MKASFSLTMKIRKDSFPEAVNSIAASDSFIYESRFISDEGVFQKYFFKIIVSDVQKFGICINDLKSHIDKFCVEECLNDLDKALTGGVLKTMPVLPADTPENYEMNILGAKEILIGKILEAENPFKISGASGSSAFVSVLGKNKAGDGRFYYAEYSRLEADALSASVFATVKAFPFILEFEIIEDFFKTLKSFEKSFFSIRINSLDDFTDYSVYRQISENISIPVLSHMYDEVPVFLTAAAGKMLSKHRIKITDSTIGFIGINSASMRTVSLLRKSGVSKILGFDSNEKIMLSFEREGGLATTAENIFSNCDAVIVQKNCFSDEDISRMRPNILIISNLDDEEFDDRLSANKSCREILRGRWFDAAAFFPFMLINMRDFGVNHLSDERALDAAAVIEKSLDSSLRFPSPFGGIKENLLSIF